MPYPSCPANLWQSKRSLIKSCFPGINQKNQNKPSISKSVCIVKHVGKHLLALRASSFKLNHVHQECSIRIRILVNSVPRAITMRELVQKIV